MKNNYRFIQRHWASINGYGWSPGKRVEPHQELIEHNKMGKRACTTPTNIAVRKAQLKHGSHSNFSRYVACCSLTHFVGLKSWAFHSQYIVNDIIVLYHCFPQKHSQTGWVDDQTRQVGVVWVGLRATSKHLRKSNRVGHPAK